MSIAHELLVSVDWMHREAARARLRVLVKRILRKHGYPPDLQDAAVQTVIQQAEVLSARWAACLKRRLRNSAIARSRWVVLRSLRGALLIPLHHRVGQDVEQAIPDLARAGNAGLIITSGAGTFRNRDLIVRLAAEHKLEGDLRTMR